MAEIHEMQTKIEWEQPAAAGDAGRLTQKQKAVAEEYMAGGSIAQAAERAGCDKSYARKVLKMPRVQAYIRRGDCEEGERDVASAVPYGFQNEVAGKDEQQREKPTEDVGSGGRPCTAGDEEPEIQERVEITQIRVLTELAKIGFASVGDFARLMGGKKDTDYVNALRLLAAEEDAAAVAQIKQGVHGVEIKLYDKLKALELLGKHLGLFGSGGAAQEQGQDNFAEALRQATRRVWGSHEE